MDDRAARLFTIQSDFRVRVDAWMLGGAGQHGAVDVMAYSIASTGPSITDGNRPITIFEAIGLIPTQTPYFYRLKPGLVGAEAGGDDK